MGRFLYISGVTILQPIALGIFTVFNLESFEVLPSGPRKDLTRLNRLAKYVKSLAWNKFGATNPSALFYIITGFVTVFCVDFTTYLNPFLFTMSQIPPHKEFTLYMKGYLPVIKNTC